MNVVIAIYSIVSICGIVISVVCVMELNGWEFGVAESIAVVVLIGFSVDYVVHLANHYVESAFTKRDRRIGHALKEMGVSILSGAVTTILSGSVLILCVTILFDKFAIIIVSTIFFSLVMSLGLFSSLCHLMGPNDHFGDLRYWIIRPLKNLIKKIFAKKGGEKSSSTKVEKFKSPEAGEEIRI